MKKYVFGILGAVTLSCIVLSCTMPVEPSAEAGFGRVIVSFADGPARTVVPETVFHHYSYKFTKTGGTAQPETPDMSGTFTLETGEYTVTVDAYAGEADSTLAATGTSGKFTLKTGEVTPVTVSLAGKTETGRGTFKWNIQYPTGIYSNQTFTLKKLPDLTPDVLSDLSWGRTSLVSLETGKPVTAGFYLASVNLELNGRKAGKTEVVHIYNSMTTEFGTADKPIIFESDDFARQPLPSNVSVSIVKSNGQPLESPLQGTEIIKASVENLSNGTKSYQWYRHTAAAGEIGEGAPISGATSDTYTLSQADGAYISVTVTSDYYIGSVSSANDNTPPVGPVKKSVASVYELQAYLADLPDNSSGNTSYEVALTGGSLASLRVTAANLGVTANQSGRKASIDLSGLTSAADTSLNTDAFKECTTLTGVTLPSTLTEIKASAFNGCTSLAEITLPASTAEIRANAFSGCNSLTTVICLATVPPNIAGSAFPTPPASPPPSIIIKVLDSSLQAYRESDWANFVSNADNDIIAISP